ncbi:hypothetical protein TNCV_2451441 [Trichonephila clavipes]|nr:hypothetical protein TNCV_2451441 [Trichonephila clavipes]
MFWGVIGAKAKLTKEQKTNRMGICFHPFGPQKHLGGKQFEDDDKGVPHDTATQKILYSWNWGWDKCINVADYAEKQKFST